MNLSIAHDLQLELQLEIAERNKIHVDFLSQRPNTFHLPTRFGGLDTSRKARDVNVDLD